MPFESHGAVARRIAVVGAGISGMAAAHLLGDTDDIVLFEAEPRLGGHARTLIAGRRGDQPVDTGFIVYNRVNYPNLVALFEKLDVPVAKSSMTFGASIDGGRLEYGLRNLGALFAQPGNALNPRFLGMVRDILRFNARGRQLAQDETLTVRDFLERLGTGAWFRDYYLLPISASIWSMPVAGILDFPAASMIRFFDNHALMNITGQHQWYTVRGGSVEYVRRLQAAMTRQRIEIRTGAAVVAVRRVVDGEDIGVEVRTQGGEWEFFDEVVFATHADDTLALLADAHPEERAALSAVRYQPNEVVLHADPAMMPRRRAAWASWVYTEAKGRARDRIDLTYWMNSLQPIPMDDPLFVTLNASDRIRPDLIHDTATFHHPVFNLAAIAAQAAIKARNGTHATWFCGAWMRNGFHEDGFASAVDVVTRMVHDRRRQHQAVA